MLGTATLRRFYEGIDQGHWPHLMGTIKDLDREVQITTSPDDFRVVVSGDMGGSHVLICTQQGIIGWPVTKPIELPENWDETLKENH